MAFPPYRCASCVTETNRCESCRAKRADALSARRATHRAARMCTECTAPVGIDVSTGETHLQCDAHRAGNARRAAAARARSTLSTLLVLGLASVALIACEPELDAVPTMPGVVATYGSAAGSPSVDAAGSAAPEPDAGAPVAVVAAPPVAGSPAPVAVEPAPAGSAAPAPVAGSPAPVAVEPAPAPAPVAPTLPAYTSCRLLGVGGVHSCTLESAHWASNQPLSWTVDHSTYRCAGLGGAQGDAPVCVPGAACLWHVSGESPMPGVCE